VGAADRPLFQTLEEMSLYLTSGALFNARYRVVQCLNSGGMGAVYEVVDERLERRRALKVMLPDVLADPDLRARFELETKATAEVRSEHVVETTDAGVDPATGAPFLVMELLRGEDLETVLQRRGALRRAEVVLFLRQAALALERVHAADVVHRDLKPANLFVTWRDDGSALIKVFDFGVARKVVRASEQPHTTRILGTPAYMSPEQIRGDGAIGPRSDLYSMGHIAFALLTGKPYWWPEQRDGGMWLLAGKVVLGLPEPATARARTFGVELPAAFDAWFAKATALEAADRFASASDLVERLAMALDVEPKGGDLAPSATAGRASVQPLRRRPIALVATLLAALSALVTLGVAAPPVRRGAPTVVGSTERPADAVPIPPVPPRPSSAQTPESAPLGEPPTHEHAAAVRKPSPTGAPPSPTIRPGPSSAASAVTPSYDPADRP
jgi:serine/threonine-protein kinase